MALVLFISNSNQLHRRVKALLEDESIDFIPSKDHEEAIKIFRQRKPEVALIDICLMERSGLDIAKEIITDNSETRVLMMSDIDTGMIRTYALRCGARDVLVKPFSDAEFVFTVKKYLEDLGATTN